MFASSLTVFIRDISESLFELEKRYMPPPQEQNETKETTEPLRTDDIPYFSTSSKCLRCCMMTSRCFSRIASAINKWKLLLR